MIAVCGVRRSGRRFCSRATQEAPANTTGKIQRNAKKDYTNPMPTRLWLRAAELLITAALAIAVLSTWRADRRDRAQLAADLAAAKQALEQADTRQHERDTQLVQTLATLAAEKRTVTTPAQIVRELPQQISLPSPIVLQPAPFPNPPGEPTHVGAAADAARDSNQTQAAIPAEDLKPLYDFTLDCKACQSKLATAQGDLADERAKTAVLTRERDQAVRAAKGGSLLRRMARNAKWFVIGAAAAAIATKAHS